MRDYKVTMTYLGGATRVTYILAQTAAHAVVVAQKLYAPRAIVGIFAEVK